jgi:hypothetical protein
MHVDLHPNRDDTLLRIGAIGAIAGSILQVGAGTASGTLTGGDAAAVLSGLAERPVWLAPLIYLGFIVGALGWVAGLIALSATLIEGASWALGRLAVATVIVGVTLHAVDGLLHGPTLASLAAAWAGADPTVQSAQVQAADLVLRILEGSWGAVVTFFHGVPFVLAGWAVLLSERYPAWLGWLGLVGGGGSVIIGALIFLMIETGPALPGLAVPFAVILSLFMLILGALFLNQAGNRSTEMATR